MNRLMNTVISVAVAAMAASSVFAADKPAVTVNGEPIAAKALEREVKALIPQASYHASVSDAKKRELQKEALENLINKELLFQYAKAQALGATPKEMAKAERDLIKSAGGQRPFEQALVRNGMTIQEFRSSLEAELSIEKLYKAKVERTFSDDELKAYYNKYRYKFKEPEKIDVQMIYTRNDPEVKNGGKIAMDRAKEAMAKLKKGEEFGAVASVYSNDMTRIKGGNLGMIHRGQIPNAKAENAAYALKKGEISDIVETDVGCYIFKVKDRREATQVPFSKIKEKLRSELKENREKAKMELILRKLKREAKIVR